MLSGVVGLPFDRPLIPTPEQVPDLSSPSKNTLRRPAARPEAGSSSAVEWGAAAAASVVELGAWIRPVRGHPSHFVPGRPVLGGEGCIKGGSGCRSFHGS
jgi:hypothetical protein